MDRPADFWAGSDASPNLPALRTAPDPPRRYRGKPAAGTVLITARHGLALHQDKDKHMKIGDMIESKYLKQSDVESPTIVTLQALKKVNVARDDEDPEYRWTGKFAELPKPMVLNVTNLKRFAKAHGDDTENWLGQQVELYVDPDIEFGGNIVGGLRIRGLSKVKRPATRHDERDPPADSDVPF